MADVVNDPPWLLERPPSTALDVDADAMSASVAEGDTLSVVSDVAGPAGSESTADLTDTFTEADQVEVLEDLDEADEAAAAAAAAAAAVAVPDDRASSSASTVMRLRQLQTALPPLPSPGGPLAHAHERLRAEHRRRLERPATAALQRAREKLPAAQFKEAVVKAVRAHPVVIVCGETGCGKTTQVPQFLLDAALEEGWGASASLVVTQPRRLAATAVAERVAQERGDTLGKTVGYAIRLQTKASAETRLLFCTTGILLARLQSGKEPAARPSCGWIPKPPTA